jgi:hypothetical protein
VLTDGKTSDRFSNCPEEEDEELEELLKTPDG